MSNRVIKKPVAVAIGAALISSIAVAGIAQASAFAVSSLGSGYMLSAGDPPAAAPAEEKPAEARASHDFLHRRRSLLTAAVREL